MSTYESELDAVLDPLARAVMAAWDGEPAALRIVSSQAWPDFPRRRPAPKTEPDLLYNVQDVRTRPTLATSTPGNVIGFKHYARRRSPR